MSRISQKDLQKKFETKLLVGNVSKTIVPKLSLRLMDAVNSGMSVTDVNNLIEDLIKEPAKIDKVLTQSFESWPCKWKG